jgi:hypothetical protein
MAIVPFSKRVRAAVVHRNKAISASAGRAAVIGENRFWGSWKGKTKLVE